MSLFDHIKNKPDSLESFNADKLSAMTAQDVATTDITDPENTLAETVQDFIASATDVRHYSVGIDLGTTHCVLSYVDITDIDEDEYVQQVLAIPQVTSPGVVEESYQLPSFLYQAHESELAAGSTSLPWNVKPEYLVGEIARNLGSKTPIRLVSSAKSWLCHADVDCKAPILPATNSLTGTAKSSLT